MSARGTHRLPHNLKRRNQKPHGISSFRFTNSKIFRTRWQEVNGNNCIDIQAILYGEIAFEPPVLQPAHVQRALTDPTTELSPLYPIQTHFTSKML